MNDVRTKAVFLALVLLHQTQPEKIEVRPSMKSTTFALALFVLLNKATGSVIYSADFTPNGVGFTHSSASPPATSGSASTSNFTLSYSSAPGTDATANSFITNSGAVFISDWGGTGVGTSSLIDVSLFSLVDISLSATELANGASVGAEYFEWAYQLDSSPVVTQRFSGPTPSNLAWMWSAIDVSSASTLWVGFRFNVDGASDGFSVTSMSVSAVPELSSSGATAVLLLAPILRRRREPKRR